MTRRAAVPAVPQHLTALARAQDVRLRLAALKREIHDLPHAEGRALIASWLTATPLDPIVGAARTEGLLLAVRYMGRKRVITILRRADVNVAARKVRELTPRQRGVIASELLGPAEEQAA